MNDIDTLATVREAILKAASDMGCDLHRRSLTLECDRYSVTPTPVEGDMLLDVENWYEGGVTLWLSRVETASVIDGLCVRNLIEGAFDVDDQLLLATIPFWVKVLLVNSGIGDYSLPTEGE